MKFVHTTRDPEPVTRNYLYLKKYLSESICDNLRPNYFHISYNDLS